jgi:ribonuclease HI
VIRLYIELYTDGAAKGNPGPGGYGVVILWKNSKGIVKKKEFSEGFRLTTNSRMEIMAVIRGLKELSFENPCSIDVYSDSAYVINTFNKGWLKNWKKNDWKKIDGSDVLNKDLIVKLDELASQHRLNFHWVKGHNGHPLNERCDDLAVKAATFHASSIDEAYETKDKKEDDDRTDITYE